jgi:N-acetylneuraminic acid mutarotase
MPITVDTPTVIGLSTGIVIAIGGEPAASAPIVGHVQRYDPSTDTWSVPAPLSTPRTLVSAAELPSGMVLVAGGVDISTATGAVSASCEIV